MNKKAVAVSMVVYLTLAVLVILIGYRIYSMSSEKSEGISNIGDQIFDNLIGQTGDSSNPCPCSTGNRRVTVNDQIYCYSSYDQARCEAAGFSFTDGNCYYTAEQCTQFLG
jgi:membrane protein implicated in regulation of membrane protease activity